MIGRFIVCWSSLATFALGTPYNCITDFPSESFTLTEVFNKIEGMCKGGLGKGPPPPPPPPPHPERFEVTQAWRYL